MESVYDHLIKRNNCYRVDAKYENLITSGAASKVMNNSSLPSLLSSYREITQWKISVTALWT